MLFALLLLILSACGGGRSGTGLSGDEVASSGVDDAERGEALAETALAHVGGYVTEVRTEDEASPAAFGNRDSRVRAEMRERASRRVGGIEVDVEDNQAKTATAADGSFALLTDAEGPRWVRFRRSRDDIVARLPIDLPRGAELSLRGIRIDDSTGVATADLQEIAFEALLDEADCRGERLLVSSRYDDARRSYPVDLREAWLGDARGEEIACEDLRRDDRLDVRGVVQPDGHIAYGTTERQ